jgi:lipase
MNYIESFIPVHGQGVEGQVAVYEQVGDAAFKNQPLLFCHATGFHAHCWDEVVRQLPERRIILLDTRCHGKSSNLEPPFEWGDFADDLVEVIDALDLKNIVGIGHSMGGHLMIRAAALRPEKFAKILAIDPVIFSENQPRMRDLIPEGFEHPVAKRRDNWVSSVEMLNSFSQKSPFNAWHTQVLKDYCDYALEQTEQGMKLACPPRLEANIYLTPDSEGAYTLIPKVKCPVHIVRARSRTENDPPFGFGPSPTNPELAKKFTNARDTQLNDNSHFIPMEVPHKVATMIREELAAS